MKEKLNTKQGISLIVLVITIIVIIILAVAVILTLANNNPIQNAKDAVKANDEATLKEEATLLYADWYLLKNVGEGTDLTAQQYVEKYLSDGYTKELKDKLTVSDDGEITIGGESASAKQWALPEGDKKVDVGDLITSKKKTTEQFYVIGIDGDTVSLLSKYNLKSDGSEQDTTGAQNTCAFSSTYYWDPHRELSYPLANGKYPNLNDKTTYPLGSATSIVTTAEAYGESLDVTGRLMTYEEASGLETSNSTIIYGRYESGKYLNYWLGSAYRGYSVWYVYGYDGTLGNYDYVSDCGVRPVIEISASSIQ